MMRVLGKGVRRGPLALSGDEWKAIQKLYGFTPEAASVMQAGADLNALRIAEVDGLRMLAWFAKHVPAGEDPLKTLVTLAVEAGWDVDPSEATWAEDDGVD